MKRARAEDTTHVTLNELLEEKRVAFTEPDGKEIFEDELDSTALFARNVAKVDFTEKEPHRRKKLKADEPEEKEREVSPEPIQRWPFERAFENIRLAWLEMDSMISLMDMVQRKEFVSLHMIQKPAPTPDILANSLAFRVMAKQQQMQKASAELQKAASRIMNLNSKQDIYCSQLLQLRKHWKLKSKSASPLTVTADWSYATDVPSLETEVVKAVNGNPSMRIPALRLNKQLSLSISPFPPTTVPTETLSEEAESSAQCSALLSNAMRSRFDEELFQQLTQDSIKSASSCLHCLENEIKYEDDHNAICFSYSMGKESQEDVGEINKEWTSSVVMLILRKMMQRQHRVPLQRQQSASLRGKHIRLTTSPQPVGAAGGPDQEAHGKREKSILWRAIRAITHDSFRKRVKSVLDEIAKTTPFFHVHWLFPDSAVASFVRIFFGDKLVLDITLEGTMILCGSCKPLHSPEEFGEFVLVRISNRLVTDVSTSANQLGCQLLRRDLLIHSQHDIPSLSVAMAIVPEETRIRVEISHMTKEQFVQPNYSSVGKIIDSHTLHECAAQTFTYESLVHSLLHNIYFIK